MIGMLLSVVSLALIFVARRNRQLRKDNAIFLRQRDAAHGFLQSAESYARALEQEQFEIRRVVGARIKERTVEAVRRKISEKRVWS